MKKIICISGDLGSGKSTVGRIIAKKLGYEYYSAGIVFRQIAEGMGINVLELNNLSDTDPSIDGMIDSKIAQIGREKEEIIIDARMAWHFVKEGFNVYMTVNPEEAARRVVETSRGPSESYKTTEEAMEGLAKRREAEAERYLEKYRADISYMGNYHLVINTDYMSPEEAAGAVIDRYHAYLKGNARFLGPNVNTNIV